MIDPEARKQLAGTVCPVRLRAVLEERAAQGYDSLGAALNSPLSQCIGHDECVGTKPTPICQILHKLGIVETPTSCAEPRKALPLHGNPYAD